jgi:hypothetical protein
MLAGALAAAGEALARAGMAAVPARDAAITATAAVAIRRIMVPFALICLS